MQADFDEADQPGQVDLTALAYLNELHAAGFGAAATNQRIDGAGGQSLAHFGVEVAESMLFSYGVIDTI